MKELPMSAGPEKSALIVGASRGLGLGLAKELLGRGWHVTATVRSAPKNSELLEYHGQVKLDTVDINNVTAVDAFVRRIHDDRFDVVFINAGIGGPEGKTAETVSPDEMTHLFMTNAISPVRMAYKLLPMVKPKIGILAFMTSILGSVSSNDHGTMPLYSASKAALNQLTRGFVATMDADITVLSLHPGWVKTEMGGPHADIDIGTSVRGLASVLEAKAGSGGHEYLDYRGETLPW
jgi:NAD(P)-dependent dehydrogenase (short-subunit alcohol dehydrogenase family)